MEGAAWCADKQNKEEAEDTWSEKFAALLTGLYAEQQAAAAEKCGVSGGESWRVAFESASNSGAKQVKPFTDPVSSVPLHHPHYTTCFASPVFQRVAHSRASKSDCGKKGLLLSCEGCLCRGEEILKRWRPPTEPTYTQGHPPQCPLQVLLGDLPADISSRRLGDGVLRSAVTNLGVIVTAAAATIAAEVTHRLPGMKQQAGGGDRFISISAQA